MFFVDHYAYACLGNGWIGWGMHVETAYAAWKLKYKDGSVAGPHTDIPVLYQTDLSERSKK